MSEAEKRKRNTPVMRTPAVVEIYGLHDPETGALRYIGKANDAQKRLVTHLRDSSRRKTPVYRWIRSLMERGLRPKMKVIYTAWWHEWEVREQCAIEYARSQGERLLNLAPGGNAPPSILPTRDDALRMVSRRPANIMRIYREMESSIRVAQRYSPGHVDSLRSKRLQFQAGVNRHREAGTLADLDARIGSYLVARNKRARRLFEEYTQRMAA